MNSNSIVFVKYGDIEGLRVTEIIKTPLSLDPEGTPFFRLLRIKTGSREDEDINGASQFVTIVPDALGIHGETIISERRAKRPMPSAPKSAGNEQEEMTEADGCHFCDMRENMPADSSGTPVAMDNDFSFSPCMHKIMIFAHDFYGLRQCHILDSYKYLREVCTEEINKHGGIFDGIIYGMNCGRLSGASQRHWHTQLTAVTTRSFNPGDRIGHLCHAYQRQYGRDYMDDYAEALRRSGLVLAEDDHVILYAPISPRFRLELQLMIKTRGACNIIRTTPEILRSVAKHEFRALSAYRSSGIEHFNIVMYSARFSEKAETGQRLIICYLPRHTTIAFSELASRYVVDSPPWHYIQSFHQQMTLAGK